MKKRTISLLAAMALALLLCVPALAAGFDETKLNFVTDEAGILTEQEWSELETRADENLSEISMRRVYHRAGRLYRLCL